MGEGPPKPLRPLAGRPLVAHVMTALCGSCRPLSLNTSDAGSYAVLGLPIVPDLRPGFLGPLAGIEAGLKALEDDPAAPSHLLVVPGDTPFLPRTLAEALVPFSDRPTVARFRGRLQPAVGLWPVCVRPRLSAWLDRGRSLALMAFLDETPFEMVEIGATRTAPGGDPFFNVNTMNDMAACEAFLADRQNG